MDDVSMPLTVTRNGGKFRLKLWKRFAYWEVYGCSIWGRHTKRGGKRVTCGHKHKTRKAAEKCQRKMERDRPGNCQRYAVHFLEGFRTQYRKEVQRGDD